MDADELGSIINDLYNEHSGQAEFWRNISSEASEYAGTRITAEAARGKWRRWVKKYEIVVEKVEKEFPEIKEVVDNFDDDLILESDSIYTLDGLLEAFEVDLDVYYVERFIPNIWDGKKQAKAFLRRKTPDLFNEEELIERIGKVVEEKSKRREQDYKVEYENDEEDCLFIPCLFDAHLSSPFFDGDYVRVLKDLMDKGVRSGYKPHRVLFPIGNDFGHFDNNKSETTHGTLVQSGETYLDSVDKRCSIIIEACDLLLHYAEYVDIVVVPGNHDRFSSYWLGKVLESYYVYIEEVTVYNSQSPRKYYKYGNSLFGFTHGSDEKKQDLVGIMAVEAPLKWAAVKNRVWFTGHLHQQARLYNMLSEKFGVVQRIFPSLVPPDDWHILKGYIGNDRAAELLLYNEKGKVGELQFSIK